MSVNDTERRLLQAFRALSSDRAQRAVIELIEVLGAGNSTGESAPPILDQDVYTIKEVCRVLKISTALCYSRRKEGRWPIPAIQPALGGTRFARADVQRYFDGAFAQLLPRRRASKKTTRWS